MSNPLMSKTKRMPDMSGRTLPSAVFHDGPAWHSAQAALRDTDTMVERLLAGRSSRMTVLPSVVLPDAMVERTCDPRLKSKKKVEERLILAGGDKANQDGVAKIEVRKRSGVSYRIANSLYLSLPSENKAHPQATQAAVADTMKDFVFARGLPNFCVDRLSKYLPKDGCASRLRPVTVSEAAKAYANCGLMSAESDQVISPLPVYDVPDDVEAIKVNTRSSNGSPVFGSLRTEGADVLVRENYEWVYTQLQTVLSEAAFDGLSKIATAKKVKDVVTSLYQSHPYMMVLVGKAKTDVYSVDKLGVDGDFSMRFYNAYPRHWALFMQQGVQAVEGLAKNILDGDNFHSAIGVSLSGGGADAMITALDEQLVKDGFAYVHVGDDTFLAVRVGGSTYLFSVDMSSFDLTQVSEVTEAIHERGACEIAAADPGAAGAWLAYMRSRPVLVANAICVLMKDAGPSGSPGQSKLVNDPLCDVGCQRVLAELKRRWGANPLSWFGGATPANVERDIADAVFAAFGSLGLVAKLECVAHVWGSHSVRAVLETTPFLFLGYYFYAEGGEVRVYADLARSMRQMVYPPFKYTTDDNAFRAHELLRSAQVLASQGLFPSHLRDAQRKLWADVGLELEKLGDDVELSLMDDDALVMVYAPDVPASARGVAALMLRGPEGLWAPTPLGADGPIVVHTKFIAVAEPAAPGRAVVERLDEVEAALERLKKVAKVTKARLKQTPATFDRANAVAAIKAGAREPEHYRVGRSGAGRPPKKVHRGLAVPLRATVVHGEDAGPSGSARTRRRDGMARRDFQHEMANLREQMDRLEAEYAEQTYNELELSSRDRHMLSREARAELRR